MIALDDNGNFVVDALNHLTSTRTPNVQCAKSELRCQQGSWFINPYFGRNQLVWTISQSTADRSLDITRIIQKYANPIAVTYNAQTQQYEAQVANA